MRLSPDFLRQYAAKPMDLFVETGCGHGYGLEIASQVFHECQSIELSESNYGHCKKRFSAHPNVRLTLGNSPDYLKTLTGHRATTFWLDAHYSGAGPKPEVECPLLDELRAIKAIDWNMPYAILVDDGYYFTANNWFWRTEPSLAYTREKWPTVKQMAEIMGVEPLPYMVKGKAKVLMFL